MKQRLTLDPRIESLLDRLYTQHTSQDEALASYFSARAQEPDFDWNSFDERTNQFLSDKLIALDREKAEFCYQVCRALRARRSSKREPRSGSRLSFLQPPFGTIHATTAEKQS